LVSIFQCSALADDGLPVVAGNVVEPDSVSVEVVEDSNTELIPLSVVWLRSTSSSSVRPVDLVIESSTGPAQSPPTHPSSSPEILLTLPGHQAGELSLLGAVVDADWSHSIGSAEPLALALGEAGAAQPPAHQEVLTSKLMIGSMTSTTASASSSSRSAASDVSSSSTSKHIGDSLEESSKLWSWRSQSKSQQIQTNKNSHFSSVSKTSVEVSGFLVE